MVLPIESTARYRYFTWPFTLALIDDFQMRAAMLPELRDIGLYPPPHATGIHSRSPFGQQLRHRLVRYRIAPVPTRGRGDHFACILTTLNGSAATAGTRFYPSKSPLLNFATKPTPSARARQTSHAFNRQFGAAQFLLDLQVDRYGCSAL
jgi:hypothetical protein